MGTNLLFSESEDCGSWRPIKRHAAQLRLHPAVVKLQLSFVQGQIVREPMEPLLITTTGIILSGAIPVSRDLGRELLCFEKSMTNEEALQFILQSRSDRASWNHFTRICVALTLEPTYKEKALVNQPRKGLAKLPKSKQVDVRKEIARVAQSGSRNVSKVKYILAHAHPRIIEALYEGSLSIHKGFYLSSLPQEEQRVQYEKNCLEQAVGGVVSKTMNKMEKSMDTDVTKVLDSLREQETRHPGTIRLRQSRSPCTTIYLGSGLQIGSRHGRGQ